MLGLDLENGVSILLDDSNFSLTFEYLVVKMRCCV